MRQEVWYKERIFRAVREQQIGNGYCFTVRYGRVAARYDSPARAARHLGIDVMIERYTLVERVHLFPNREEAAAWLVAWRGYKRQRLFVRLGEYRTARAS